MCRHCDELAPHGAVRSAEPEADTRLLIGLFWLVVFAVVTFLGLWVLVFTVGALGP